MGQVLAAKAEHQHRPRIGMPGEGSQQLPGLAWSCPVWEQPKGWVKV